MPQYSAATLWQRIKGYAFHLFPHHWVSCISYYLVRLESPLKNPLIRAYIRFFNVDMEEAEAPHAEDYRSFNHFFTRSLKPEARPIHDDPQTLIYPCDGAVMQVGNIEENTLLQAKGKRYGLKALLGGANPQAQEGAQAFTEGKFLTIYLAPGNYHRVHAPCDMELKAMTHVPGRLFSVAEYAQKAIPRLYVRNERIVSIFDSSLGEVAIILIGALNVGSIETNWAGPVTPKSLAVTHRRYMGEELPGIRFQRGEEIARFNLGSSVIMLASNPALKWNPLCVPGKEIRMGEESGWIGDASED